MAHHLILAYGLGDHLAVRRPRPAHPQELAQAS